MQPFPIRKVANAFIPGAIPLSASLERVSHDLGGLWVGGTIEVTPDGLTFVPNRLNHALHANLAPITIPAGDIRSVWREFGFLSGIVVMECTEGYFSFRCFGAKKVAASMALHFGAPCQD